MNSDSSPEPPPPVAMHEVRKCSTEGICSGKIVPPVAAPTAGKANDKATFPGAVDAGQECLVRVAAPSDKVSTSSPQSPKAPLAEKESKAPASLGAALTALGAVAAAVSLGDFSAAAEAATPILDYLHTQGSAGNFLALVLLGWLAARYGSRFLLQHWLAWRPVAADAQAVVRLLLPSQQNVAGQIIAIAGQLDPTRPGVLIGLRGGWGVGKSYVLMQMTRTLEADENTVVVPLNIWEHQRETDLHFALLKRVFGHPKIMQRCLGDFPWRLLAAPLLMGLAQFLPKGVRLNLKFSQSALEGEVSIPLTWQDSFRRVVESAVTQKLRIVVILDEIDRAEPAVAQAAVTMARRALDLPGVLTVLPYVEEQLRQKVFHPINVVSPDLKATIDAVLEKHGPIDLEGMPLPGVTQEMVEKPKWAEVNDTEALKQRYRAALLRHYFMVPASVSLPLSVWQNRFYNEFSEKYVGQYVDLYGLRSSDVAQFLRSSVLTSASFHALTLDDGQIKAMIDGQNAPAPSLRAMESEAQAAIGILHTLPGWETLGEKQRSSLALTAIAVAYIVASS